MAPMAPKGAEGALPRGPEGPPGPRGPEGAPWPWARPGLLGIGKLEARRRGTYLFGETLQGSAGCAERIRILLIECIHKSADPWLGLSYPVVGELSTLPPIRRPLVGRVRAFSGGGLPPPYPLRPGHLATKVWSQFVHSHSINKMGPKFCSNGKILRRRGWVNFG